MRKKLTLFICIFLAISLFIIGNVNVSGLLELPNDFYTNYEEVNQINNNKTFGSFISSHFKLNEVSTSNDSQKDGTVIFKLFGFIPIKKVKVKMLPEEEVFVGGVPIGLTINSLGAVVVSDSMVDMENAVINKNEYFRNGDIITNINGKQIESLNDIDGVLDNLESSEINVSYLRNNKEQAQEISLLKDKDDKYKLGVWVRDDFSGIGTLTFVRKNHDYGALGHPVTNGQTENIIPTKEGNVYSCSLVGINKGQKNNPGELKCVFVQKNKKGDVKKNTKFGIYGRLQNFDDLVDTNIKASIGGRLSVKPGKAKIISSISGIREEYDIEIIKANYQSKCDDKSIVFRVKDERLLALTGGIVQGMSGSPIVQNDKLVGAVTHVFLSDPTKGYGVYSDWMLEQMDFN